MARRSYAYERSSTSLTSPPATYCASTAREARICVETLPRTWLTGSSWETRSSSRWCGNDPAGPRFLIDGLPRTAEQARALTDLVKAGRPSPTPAHGRGAVPIVVRSPAHITEPVLRHTALGQCSR